MIGTLTLTERDLSSSYFFHHGLCLTCQAAGRGHSPRCGYGLLLWRAYQNFKASAQGDGAALAQAKRDNDATAANQAPPDGNHGGNISGATNRG